TRVPTRGNPPGALKTPKGRFSSGKWESGGMGRKESSVVMVTTLAADGWGCTGRLETGDWRLEIKLLPQMDADGRGWMQMGWMVGWSAGIRSDRSPGLCP